MTTFFLIRHGAHDWLGRELVGRRAGILLNQEGRQQAQGIAQQLAAVSLDAIYASPLERALETAAPLAAQTRLPVRVDQAFHEIDFGRWTGRTFADLEPDPLWHDWNTARATASGAGGETMSSAQARALAGVERLAREHAGGRVAVFSHGDVIKAILAHDRGLSLNELATIPADPGSITEITRER